MSDYFEFRKKLLEGEEWRGSITVELDGEETELTVRQLNDKEGFDILSDLDFESIQDADTNVSREDAQRYQELATKSELTDEEEKELEELKERVGDADLETIDDETFSAIIRAAKYGVVPDEEDVDKFMDYAPPQREEAFGRAGKDREDAKEILKEDMQKRLENSTDFTSFQVGMKVINETLSTGDEEGN